MKLTLKAVILIFGILFGLASCSKHDYAADWYSEIRSANKLVLSTMTVSKMATVDDLTLAEAKGIKQSADALLSSLKIGDRVAVYSYDAYMRAYVDLSELNPEDIKVDEKTHTVTLILPPIHTEIIGRDAGLKEEHYRVTGLRSQIDAKERSTIKEKMNKSMVEEMKNDASYRNILTDKAKEKANAYFTSLFSGSGYTPVITFRPEIKIDTE